jgi:hypothetical protein
VSPAAWSGPRRRESPPKERLVEVFAEALEASCIELIITQDGHPAELRQLVRCLDVSGLLDWKAFR